MQILLLVLSQDEGLARAVHKITVHSAPWYKERPLARASLGSLLFTVLLRAAHKNLLGPRDVYLHSNTLAALANLAPHAVHLTPPATDRLVAVLETGLKRLRWLAGPRAGSDMPDDAAAAEHGLMTDCLQVRPRAKNAGRTFVLA